MLYSSLAGDDDTRATLERRVELCREVISYLCKVDPGRTKKMGIFLLEYNR